MTKQIEKKRLEAYQKVFLSIEFINGQLFMFKDYLEQNQKFVLNSAIKATNHFLKIVGAALNQKTLESDLNHDIDLITEMFDAFIQAEEQNIEHKFRNDFYKICAENNIKI